MATDRGVPALGADGDAFAALVGRHRRELEVHCYRMLGSVQDAEDVVQETLLRAWRKRDTYRGRSTVRAWLYGIATNACLDVLGRRARRLLPLAIGAPGDPRTAPLPASEVGWLEPYPDVRLDAAGIDDVVIGRETIELAFLVAIQHLPPRQRAVLILRDVLGWSARETAEAIGTTVVAANSALQRARSTVKGHLPEQRLEWGRERTPDSVEQQLLDRYMDAWRRTDVDALVTLLARDARVSMPPSPSWYAGRDAIRTFLLNNPMAVTAPRHIHIPTRANRQPAFLICAVDGAGADRPRPFAVEVLRIADGMIAEIDVFTQPSTLDTFARAAAA